MPVESWMKPEETATLAADAAALIDCVLDRLPAEERAAFWSSVRKCYNTPYNDPAPRRHVAEKAGPAAIAEAQIVVAMAAIPAPASFGTETHAA